MQTNAKKHDTFETMLSKHLADQSSWRRFMRSAIQVIPRRVRRRFHKERPNRQRDILDAFVANTPNAIFVQIGSCDGVTGDPINKYVVECNWSGVVVEPVPYAFARLQQNYANRNDVVCENAAISAHGGRRKFWHLRQSDDDLPYWYDQLGSFDRAHIVKHAALIPNIEEYIVETEVECLSLKQLLQKHRLDRIDVFHTDTEGHDLAIFEQFDFEKYQPYVFIYEHIHLSASDRDRCEQILVERGYPVIYDGNDATAYLESCAPLASAASLDGKKHSVTRIDANY